MKYAALILVCLWCVVSQAQNQLTITYTDGHIPTSFDIYDNSCNGPSAILSLTLPPGDNYVITNVHVAYAMTASGGGWTSDQRSKIRCVNTGSEETEKSGVGDSAGTYPYMRDLTIANDTFPGGTIMVFEMWARRVWEESAGCHTTTNRVDNNTWILTITYSSEITNPKVGIDEINPTATLDINGKMKLGDDNNAPEAGMIRFNPTTQDFEGYNGTSWVSFTIKSNSDGWGDQSVHERSWKSDVSGAVWDEFGASVSLAGDYAIIGSHMHATLGHSARGKATIFYRTGNSWAQQATLIASDGAINDQFGKSVSISGDYAIVGSHLHDTGGNNNQGKAYIYYRTGTTWSQQAILTSSNGAASDFFGESVSISGDYAVVGASFHGTQNKGSAYIFKRSGTTWTEQAILTASDATQDDYFGVYTSISGDYAVVGAWGHDTNGNSNQGKAYVFKRTGTEWSQQAMLTASDGAVEDRFGERINISGDFIVVGAWRHNTSGQADQGKAYIYKRLGTNWTEQAILVAPDGVAGDQFGSGVSISSDYVVIGANKHDDQFPDVGKAYIYKRDNSNWSFIAMLTPSDGGLGDNFGNSTSISGNHIIVGSPSHIIGSSRIGAVYFFSQD